MFFNRNLITGLSSVTVATKGLRTQDSVSATFYLGELNHLDIQGSVSATYYLGELNHLDTCLKMEGLPCLPLERADAFGESLPCDFALFRGSSD